MDGGGSDGEGVQIVGDDIRTGGIMVHTDLFENLNYLSNHGN